jgi:hypothetical protein
LQILQLSRPPSYPPIFEIARPELKLAGMRIDADQFSKSKMSYYTDMAMVSASEQVPAPADKCRQIAGWPAGSWLNYISWSPDGDKIVGTRAAGALMPWARPGQARPGQWPVASGEAARLPGCDRCTLRPAGGAQGGGGGA